MSISEQQKSDYLAEVFDERKVQVKCGQHLYFGPIKDNPKIQPQIGCADCWKVFYIHELASTPANERRQKLEEMEEVLHNAVALVESGKWDIDLYDHAQIEIGKE